MLGSGWLAAVPAVLVTHSHLSDCRSPHLYAALYVTIPFTLLLCCSICCYAAPMSAAHQASVLLTCLLLTMCCNWLLLEVVPMEYVGGCFPDADSVSSLFLIVLAYAYLCQ